MSGGSLHCCMPLLSDTNVWSFYSYPGPAKSWVKIFWGISSLSGTMIVLAPPGAVPAVGGYLYPSVLRSPGATPQKCRAGHGPAMHPAVKIPLRLCMLGVCFVCLVFSGYW